MFAQSSSMDWNAEAVPTHELAGSTWICAPLFAAPSCRAASSSAPTTIVPPGESDGDKGKGKMELVKKERDFYRNYVVVHCCVCLSCKPRTRRRCAAGLHCAQAMHGPLVESVSLITSDSYYLSIQCNDAM